MTHIVEAEIDVALKGELEGIEREIRNVDFRLFLQERVVPSIIEGERSAFIQQREPGGNPWAPLSPVTIKKKGHSRILFETGKLERSLIEVGSEGNITQVNESSLVFGTSIDYASELVSGRSNMPGRPMVGMNDEQIEDIADSLADYLAEQFMAGSEEPNT